MKNKLLTLSLILSFLGVFLLLILSLTLQPKQVSNYSDLKLNNYVKTTGKITQIRTYNDFSIITLDNNLTLTCNCKLKINQTIEATGKVVEYNKELQINSDKIKS